MINKRRERARYLIADFTVSATTWILFWAFRKFYIESQKFGISVPFQANNKFFFGLVIIPLFWLFLYAMWGLYSNVYRKSRIAELKQLFLATIIGVIILFFTLLLNDTVVSYRSYYTSVAVLFSMQFFLAAFMHLAITSYTNNRLHGRKIGFNTLLVGSNQKAFQLYEEMERQSKSSGNKFVGFVHVDNSNGFSGELNKKLKYFGEFSGVQETIKRENIEEVIVAIESSEHKHIEQILNTLEDCEVIVKIIPDMYDIMTGSVRLTSILDAPLIVVSRDILLPWQSFLKRFFDVSMSLFFLIVLSPVYLIIAIIIKLTSNGPVIYSQERIGLRGKPFKIYKFRSMVKDAEKNGPSLSSHSDNRITPVGRFLRRTRMDELPQFYNVIKGDMSIVGPRPERKYYIDQIIQRSPHYKHLSRIKPGITSWGQVKYGYAENIDQMMSRMKYDLLYIENISFLLDLRIIIYTVLIVFQGRGK
jgi:exopolysaccharide biosynthesis polyprenyl glycosylphosphotransferase